MANEVIEKAIEILSRPEFNGTCDTDELISILVKDFDDPEMIKLLLGMDDNRIIFTDSTTRLVKRQARGTQPIAFGTAGRQTQVVPDWGKFRSYVSELITRYYQDKETSDWPRLEHLVLLVKNGSRYSAASSELIEKKIRELSGESETAIIEPIDDEKAVVLKNENLAEIKDYRLPRSILKEMREVLKPGTPLRISELYEEIKPLIPKNEELTIQNEPSFRRALLNKIAKSVDGIRFEFVIYEEEYEDQNGNKQKRDIVRIRKTNEFLARELEAGLPPVT